MVTYTSPGTFGGVFHKHDLHKLQNRKKRKKNAVNITLAFHLIPLKAVAIPS